jgi:hypothetical protein
MIARTQLVLRGGRLRASQRYSLVERSTSGRLSFRSFREWVSLVSPDLRLKERALERTTPLGLRPGRYRPDDKLLAFLEAL